MGVLSSVSWIAPGFGCGVPVPGAAEVAVVPVSDDEESWESALLQGAFFA
jgi:hypothetical protein